MTKIPETLIEAMERVREGSILVKDEDGYLRMKKELTSGESFRLSIRKWGPSVSLAISLIALAVSIVAILK